MDGRGFDELATSISRRGILGALAAGGLLGALGRKPASVIAQEQSCTVELTAAVRLGPSTGQFVHSSATQPGHLSGRLRFGMTESGNLDRGVLLLADGTRLPVVGDANGHTLTLRIALDGEQTLVAVGVGQESIASCQGRIDGLVTGPAVGDLGDWHATAEGRASETTEEDTANNGSSTGSGSSGSSSSSGGTAGDLTPSPTPDTGGESNPCPDQRILCGGFCTDVLYNDVHCGQCDNPCPAGTHYCEEGVCIEATCPPGTTNCFGYCADLSSSPAHCGACGNTCGAVQLCVGGVCQECTDSCGRCATNTVCCAGMGCADVEGTNRCL
jgi:hypothetical protein